MHMKVLITQNIQRNVTINMPLTLCPGRVDAVNGIPLSYYDQWHPNYSPSAKAPEQLGKDPSIQGCSRRLVRSGYTDKTVYHSNGINILANSNET